MNLRLTECREEYWEFVRSLRTDERNQQGFFTVAEISSDQQEEYMQKNSHRYKVCLLDDIPVGYVGIIGEHEITYCVHSDQKGKGVGTFMVKEFSKDLTMADAYVKVENIGSQKVFEKLGWTKQIYYKKTRFMTFNEVCNKYRTDKGDALPRGNCYAYFYDGWFSKIKDKEINICEIGIDDGNSLLAYYEYFRKANIYGLDIEDRTNLDNERIKTFIVDQSKPQDLDDFVARCKSSNIMFDFILDDGSHDVQHQQLTFGKFFQLVKPGGIYIIEDLGSSYFTLGTKLYDYYQTQDKINNNTIKFLNQRPFNSVWVGEEDTNHINQNVEYVLIYDKYNEHLPYSRSFACENNFPIRSITSVIKKK